MAHLVKLELSKKEISFQPDNFRDFSRTSNLPEDGDLQVSVVNVSDRFSSFQIELNSGSQTIGEGGQWYRVEPEICAKKPPGDRTLFTVTFLKSPVRSYDTRIPITVRVLSIEDALLTTEEEIFLKVQRPKKTLRAYLPVEDLSIYPGDRCKIPVLVYNLSSHERTVTLQLKGLDPTWIAEGIEQKLHLDAGESRESEFWCAPPPVPKSRHQVYSLLLEVSDDKSNTDSAYGNLEVLPYGQIALTCENPLKKIPPLGGWWARRGDVAKYQLALHNQSNATAQVHLSGQGVEARTRNHTFYPPPPITVEPDAINEVPFEVQAERPWLGTTRIDGIEVLPALTQTDSGEPLPQVPVQPAPLRIDLQLQPRIPFWLQVAGSLLMLFLIGLGWWLWPRPHHRAPITALTLMANGSTIISGSSDQTLRHWQVNPESWLPDIRRLKFVSVLTEPDLSKSVRTLRHLPEEVDRLAVGLENGEIQIWDIPSRQPQKTFFEANAPDRVFALDFTADSRYLFSGHGSGRVRLWDMADDEPSSPQQKLYPPENFAISALAVLEQPGQYQVMAAGGQFNRLVFWFWQDQQAFNVDYSLDWQAQPNTMFTPVISRQSYITSLSGADDAAVMASADSRGFITLWDMDTLHGCMQRRKPQLFSQSVMLQPAYALTTQGRDPHMNFYTNIDVARDCEAAVLDQWQASPSGQAIRAVALTSNGCYLSSVGDDGRVILWPLSSEYQRSPDDTDGWLLKRYSQAQLNTVDIHWDNAKNQEQVVLVAHDMPGNRVQVHRRQVRDYGCQ